MPIKLIISLFVALGLSSAMGDDIYYVAQNGQTPASPYDSWGTASSNIQDVLNIAPDLATILVGAGRYTFTDAGVNVGSNVVNIGKSITLKSEAGAANTLIDGEGKYRVVRFSLDATAKNIGPAILDGFTVTNGYAGYPSETCRGGGVYFDIAGSTTAIVQNCTITGNVMEQNVPTASDKYQGGGGLYCYGTKMPLISNCVVMGNKTLAGTEGTGSGGGLYFKTNGQILDSLFAYNDNSAMYFAAPSDGPRTVIDRCVIVSNAAGIRAYANADIRNSLIARNEGVGINVNYICNIFNSTVLLNVSHGVYYAKEHKDGIIKNCIVDKLNIQNDDVTVTGYYNCLPSIPARGDWYNTLEYGADISVIKFMDVENNDFRLQRDSPCVNAGTNDLDWLTVDALDLARLPRVDRFLKAIDMGCYEYMPRGMLLLLR